ncbi:MAG: hypothetical protein AB1810_03135, partial [Pseudomonadota bacterium]
VQQVTYVAFVFRIDSAYASAHTDCLTKLLKNFPTLSVVRAENSTTSPQHVNDDFVSLHATHAHSSLPEPELLSYTRYCNLNIFSSQQPNDPKPLGRQELRILQCNFSMSTTVLDAPSVNNFCVLID